jgi:hypothetical protein
VRKLKSFIRYEGSGRAIGSSVVLRQKMPKVGRWKEIPSTLCCGAVETTTTTTTVNVGLFNVSTITDYGCAAPSAPVLDSVLYHDGSLAYPEVGDTVWTDAAHTILHISPASNVHVYMGDVLGGGFANGGNWLYTDGSGVRLTISCK